MTDLRHSARRRQQRCRSEGVRRRNPDEVGALEVVDDGRQGRGDDRLCACVRSVVPAGTARGLTYSSAEQKSARLTARMTSQKWIPRLGLDGFVSGAESEL